MAKKFEDLVNDMVNVGFGVAATAAEKGKEVFDDLNAKGAEARADASGTDFARSMSDIFERAGGAFGDVTERPGRVHLDGRRADPRRAHPRPRPRDDRVGAHRFPRARPRPG